MAIDPKAQLVQAYQNKNINVNKAKTTPKVAPTLQASEQFRNKMAGRVGTFSATANTPLNTPLNTVQTTPDFATDLQSKVNAMYDAQQKARLNQWYSARNKGVADIQGQIGELAPQYADLRNQADVVNMQNQKAMAERMASAGLGASGENVTANIGLANARQSALSGLNLQQQKQENQFNKMIADLNDPSKEQEIRDAIESERAQALYDAFLKGDEIKFRNEERDYGRGRDVIQDKRYEDETKYERGRDTEMDKRYYDERGYARGRDTMMDKRYLEERDYERKITEREWNQMSPAEKQRMALQYSYSKMGRTSGSPGGSTRGTTGTTTTNKQAARTPTGGTTPFMKPQATSDADVMKRIKAELGENVWTEFLNR